MNTAEMPRILMPSPDAEAVFTIGMAVHSSYPGAHPNAIEYMQWDRTQKNFRFHEIVLAPVLGPLPGTDGMAAGTVQVKNKPNWDAYDSWGRMLPFNRDRIYQGSVEAAAWRRHATETVSG